ncbi:hypothetical protein pdam_00017562 [Pocillopora damicornis]|uniref:Uncharacterized protein n=1 Tax=Pocillopora damicornis TaxID=46731 RepID=A0A3M6TRU7_POCDA|nr:hypothetical protein pdam_00017562 [Pocillopora damicornis]
MNIVIGSTIQTFEQENEEIWHLEKRNRDLKKKPVFGRFFANSNFVRERLLNFPTISFLEEFSDFLEPIILSRDPLFLSFDICVDDHNDKAACHFFDLLESISLT